MFPKDDNGRPMSQDETTQVMKWVTVPENNVNMVGFWNLASDNGLKYSRAMITA